MLLILLFNLLFVLAVVATMLGKDHTKARAICRATSIVLGSIFLVLCVCAIVENSNKDANETKWFERYDSLYSQAYYKMYDSDYGKAALIDKLTKWNERLEWYNVMKSNIWVSVFYPIDTSGYRTIPVEYVNGGVG